MSKFFVLQQMELNKGALYEYKRIPSAALVRGKDISMIALADAGRDSMVMCFYLVYCTASGEKVSSLLMSQSYLMTPISTIPKSELHILSLAATMLREITSERVPEQYNISRRQFM